MRMLTLAVLALAPVAGCTPANEDLSQKGKATMGDELKISGRNIDNSTFRDSHMKQCRFSNLDMSGATFENINLSGTTFENINLSKTRFHDINFSDVAISAANFGGAQFVHIGPGPDETGKHPPQRPVLFKEADLNGSTFEKVDLSNVKIVGCDLEGMTIDGILVTEMIEAFKRSSR